METTLRCCTSQHAVQAPAKRLRRRIVGWLMPPEQWFQRKASVNLDAIDEKQTLPEIEPLRWSSQHELSRNGYWTRSWLSSPSTKVSSKRLRLPGRFWAVPWLFGLVEVLLQTSIWTVLLKEDIDWSQIAQYTKRSQQPSPSQELERIVEGPFEWSMNLMFSRQDFYLDWWRFVQRTCTTRHSQRWQRRHSPSSPRAKEVKWTDTGIEVVARTLLDVLQAMEKSYSQVKWWLKTIRQAIPRRPFRAATWEALLFGWIAVLWDNDGRIRFNIDILLCRQMSEPFKYEEWQLRLWYSLVLQYALNGSIPMAHTQHFKLHDTVTFQQGMFLHHTSFKGNPVAAKPFETGSKLQILLTIHFYLVSSGLLYIDLFAVCITLTGASTWTEIPVLR